MSTRWQLQGQVVGGGDVLDIAADADGRLWLATTGGLFYGSSGHWSLVAVGLPFSTIGAVFTTEDTVFVAGQGELSEGLVRSVDKDGTWHSCWLDQIQSPLTCIAASPRFAYDRTMLAGAYGEGVLRSTDGGRFWQLSSYGLREFNVLALAVAADWNKREVAFVATEGGVYRSPNGGRAWRASNIGLENVVVQALAASPGGLTFAGTEDDGIFRSEDSGTSWTRLSIGSGSQPSINCLTIVPLENGSYVVLAGTSQHGLLRSQDRGETWEQTDSDLPAVLSLASAADRLYAGVYREGLLSSLDSGETWVREEGLAAHRFDRLVASPPNLIAVAGPNEGIWLSTDSGVTWGPASGWLDEMPVLNLAAANVAEGTLLLAVTQTHVFRSEDAGRSWEHVLDTNPDLQEVVSALTFSPVFAADGRAWAGSISGHLWTTQDAGHSWQLLETPFGPRMVVALAASPHDGNDDTLLAAVADIAGQEVQLWRTTDGGTDWQRWLVEPGGWFSVHLVAEGPKGAQSAFAMGPSYLWHGLNGWQRAKVTSLDSPINALLEIPGTSRRLASSAAGIFTTDNRGGRHWRAFDEGLQAEVPAQLALSPQFDTDRTVYLLTYDGKVWKRRVD